MLIVSSELLMFKDFGILTNFRELGRGRVFKSEASIPSERERVQRHSMVNQRFHHQDENVDEETNILTDREKRGEYLRVKSEFQRGKKK